MTAKQWLSRGRGIDREINSLLNTKRELYEQLTTTTARYDGEVVSGTKDPHKYDRLAEIEDLIDNRIDDLTKIRAEILTTINQLDDWRYRELLRSRYIDMKSFEEIAVGMHYTWRQIMRFHKKSLAEIENVISCHIDHVV